MILQFASILLFKSLSVYAAPWVVTSYVQIDISVYTGYTSSGIGTNPGDTQSGTTYSWTDFISPTGTVAPSGLSTLTTTSGYSDVNIVEIVLPSGAGSTISPSFGGDDGVVTDFYVPVTYEPFTTCKSKWKFATEVPISVPSPVQPHLTPITVSTSTSSYSVSEILTTFTNYYTTVSALLNPTDVPDDAYKSASSAYQPDGVSLCVSPTTTAIENTATETVSSYGISCGKENPQCEGCSYYIATCNSIGNGCGPADSGTYYDCPDGKKYWITGGPGSKASQLAWKIAAPIAFVLVVIGFCALKAKRRGGQSSPQPVRINLRRRARQNG
ncbi:uncharacterized protein PAC_18167 [Phialocephala subalpina]|uniref:Uncharacterized protein n=1 Tax=Phialocephala subalpina TaxID=576137 RepID=A0A1L7XTG4_9HELO|nr:uncharacterized protein PAC_18167 [Phialocephala subalpina]